MCPNQNQLKRKPKKNYLLIIGYSILSEKFKLCNPISDQAGYNHLIGWMRNAFASITMADYPYAGIGKRSELLW